MIHTQRRTGFSLVELIVVLAIMAVTAGLSVSAVQQVRETANRTRCTNHLKQLGLACHNYHDANRLFPPGIGYYPELPPEELQRRQQPFGNWLIHLLPHLESGNLYQLSYHWGDPQLHSRPIPVFSCPSDPTLGEPLRDNLGRILAGSSYAGNAQVFCRVNSFGVLRHVEGKPNLERSFPDGTSLTILAA
jgi:prepilin-type N-terminal cleavage/methylation domain-containing protein